MLRARFWMDSQDQVRGISLALSGKWIWNLWRVITFNEDDFKRTMGQKMDENNRDAPLDLIRSKERELAGRLKDAENQAKEKVAAARRRAAAIQQEAEIAGQGEAEQLYQHQISRAREATAAINDAGRREAEQLTRRGEKHLDRAVQIVIDSIFPS